MCRRLEERWNRLRTQVSLRDLTLDVSGKLLAAAAAGALLAPWLRPCAWWMIGAGLLVSIVVKAKYWKRFWGSG